MNTIKLALISFLSVFLLSSPSFAGGKMSEDKILAEIGYMANQLLELHDEDSYTVESPKYTKPFIGICTSINEDGVLLTCVTPGTQAAKAGLRTGDLVSKMNDIQLVDSETKMIKSAYYKIVHNMKLGDIIAFTLKRDNKVMQIDVEVGGQSQPSFTLTVNK